jgi:hypothetical protein
MHDNILAEPFTKEPDHTSKIYNAFSLSEDIHSIPYNDLSEVFDVNKIISSLN